MLRKVLIGCGVVFALFLMVGFGAMMYLGFQIESGDIPDTLVLYANEIKPPVRDAIESVANLAPDERIEFYYSSGLFRHTEDMNIVTNYRVISYQEGDDGRGELSEIRLDNIASVDMENQGSFLEDAVVVISTVNGSPSYFRLLLSVEDNRHQRVIEFLKNRSE